MSLTDLAFVLEIPGFGRLGCIRWRFPFKILGQPSYSDGVIMYAYERENGAVCDEDWLFISDHLTDLGYSQGSIKRILDGVTDVEFT